MNKDRMFTQALETIQCDENGLYKFCFSLPQEDNTNRVLVLGENYVSFTMAYEVIYNLFYGKETKDE